MNTRPQLEKFRKGDLVQYFNNVLEIVTEERAELLNIWEQRKAFEEIMERFNNSWQPNKGSELTPMIQKLDNERDSLFMGLKMTVDAWANHHYDENKREAAFLISDKISSINAKVTRMRYQQATATINALVADFMSELENEIIILGLIEWTKRLKKANTEFNEKYVERAKALSSEQEGVVVKMRSESTEIFRALISIFEARMAIAKVEENNFEAYKIVNDELGELTEQYNEAVQKHSSQE